MASSDIPTGFISRLIDIGGFGVRRLRPAVKATMPTPLLRGIQWLRKATFTPPVGKVDFGDLRRLTPFRRGYGYDRGRPIDRYYIETFLEKKRSFIQGRVLEIGDDSYTRTFGGDQVTRSDVLHAYNVPQAIIVLTGLDPDSLAITELAFGNQRFDY
jgi:hypothetical protein